jgi:hypothetical protein
MTDEATAIAEEPHFSIGQVIEDSFETLLRIFPIVLAIVAIIAVPLIVWLVLGGESLLVRFAATAGVEASTSNFNPVMAVLVLLIGLIVLGIHAAVSDAAFRHLLGEAGDLVRNLSRALVSAPSLLVAGLFVSVLFASLFFALTLAAGLVSVLHWVLGVLVGLPGLAGLTVLMVRWWVVVPAIVIEQTGPFACFGRSNRLTEGNRWQVFAVLLLITLPESLVKLVLYLATPLLGAAFIAVLNITVSGLFIVFNAVATVMIYAHLRAIKEGAGTAELADVFE